MKALFVLVLLTMLSACTGLPKSVEPVTGFESEKYLGTWYEIARLDHRFERGLSNVTATYSKRDDGGLVVINRGYEAAKGEWTDATGKAYFVGDSAAGHLKVSFFGPFYASYAIFELDKNDYQYAFVSGHNTKFLWLLSRTPTVSDDFLEQFKARVDELVFASEELVLVDQTPVE